MSQVMMAHSAQRGVEIYQVYGGDVLEIGQNHFADWSFISSSH